VAVAVFDGENDLDENVENRLFSGELFRSSTTLQVVIQITTINILDEQELLLLLLVDVEVNEVHNIGVGDVGEDVGFVTRSFLMLFDEVLDKKLSFVIFIVSITIINIILVVVIMLMNIILLLFRLNLFHLADEQILAGNTDGAGDHPALVAEADEDDGIGDTHGGDSATVRSDVGIALAEELSLGVHDLLKRRLSLLLCWLCGDRSLTVCGNGRNGGRFCTIDNSR